VGVLIFGLASAIAYFRKFWRKVDDSIKNRRRRETADLGAAQQREVMRKQRETMRAARSTTRPANDAIIFGSQHYRSGLAVRSDCSDWLTVPGNLEPPAFPTRISVRSLPLNVID